AYTIRNLGFLTGQHDLISPDNPLVALSRQLDPFEDRDAFLVAIEGKDRQQSLAFLHTLVSRLDGETDLYDDLFYRLNPERFRDWALLYLDAGELSRLVENVKDHEELIRGLSRSPDLNTFFDLVNREMTSRMVGEIFTGFLDEDAGTADRDKAFDLSFLIEVLQSFETQLRSGVRTPLEWNTLFGADEQPEKDQGYFWTEDDRLLLAFVTPARKQKQFNKTAYSLNHLRSAISQIQEQFPGLEAGVTGREALDADEMSASISDMSLATLLSLAGLLVLLIVFWKTIRRPVLEITELVLALSWTFGLTTLVVGHLNILSVVFAPLLLGLGIDYGIHWFARFEEEMGRTGGKDLEKAVRTTHMEVGPGIVLAGLCAAFSFLPLILTGFRGLVELGLITAVGMVMTTVTTTCILPALTLLFERRLKPAKRTGHAPLYVFKLGRRSSQVILLAALAGMAVSLVVAPGIRFDLNLLHMQPRKAESVVWEHKLMEDSERSALTASILLSDLNEVRVKSQELEALPVVSEVSSILSFLPDAQEDKIPLLEHLKPLVSHLGPIRPTEGAPNIQRLEDTLSRIRFKMSPDADWGVNRPLARQMEEVRDRIDSIRSVMQNPGQEKIEPRLADFSEGLFEDFADKLDLLERNVRSSPMRIRDLPSSLLDRYVGEGPVFRIKIYPAGDVWDTDRLERFVREVRAVDPKAAGDAVTLYVFTHAFRRACTQAALYAVIAIFVLLLISFRNIKTAFLAFVPLIVGTSWTLGLMRLFQVDFNLANSLFLPLIVGAGVEYGIIVMTRGRVSSDSGLPAGTVKGVALAALTTTVGFGTLMISSHRGIYSLGLLAAIGSLCMLCSAVLVLPALMGMWRKTGRSENPPQ
ncbi:MAG: MMPL family transporter, partial [Deltaproteobacteria bacterium]|nr:MMPL family transporter [Deltaproteobacteria bacterium]